MANFAQFNLNAQLLHAITEVGFKTPTKVQIELIPSALSGKDIVGQSQTGSGKTHVFLIPIFEKLDPDDDTTQAIILAPSRELADQIFIAANNIDDNLDSKIKIQLLVGGTDRQKSIQKIKATTPQVIVGTPGRVADLIKTNNLSIHKAKFLVIDEADMTLEMGFLQEVDFIANVVPDDVQTMVFSATIPQKLEPFLKQYLKNPLIKVIKSDKVIADTIDNWLLPLKSSENNQVILKLLQRQTPFLTLIFTNTKERVQELYNFLSSQRINVVQIHGDIPPRQRKKYMSQINKLQYQVVVATDLAARGIDIDGVTEVINDDLPANTDFFIHRVGRTGRNQKPGLAITLMDPNEQDKINQLENLGITFKTKQFKQDQLVDYKDRNQRNNRRLTRSKLEGAILGDIKKNKKDVKPGYKKRIKSKIDMQRRSDKRINDRKARRAGK